MTWSALPWLVMVLLLQVLLTKFGDMIQLLHPKDIAQVIQEESLLITTRLETSGEGV